MSNASFSLEPKEVKKIKTKNRRIVTKIPVPESIELFNTLDKYESRSMHGQLPIVWNKAQGHSVYDFWGNKWIDFTSTIFVANAGHGNKHIVNSIKKILKKPLLHTYTYASKERADYIKYLIDNTPSYFEKAFLMSSGTEATECAFKLMRMQAWKAGKKQAGIIAFENNWHGRTLGSQMMSYNKKQKEWIGYIDPNIYHLPFPYQWNEKAVKDPKKFFLDSLDDLFKEKNLTADDIGGFMLETYQGWSAAFYPKEFVQAVSEFAKQNNITVCFDEMQSGFGRTGKLFGYMHYEVEPDLICCGKGASSSLPLSLVLGRKDLLDLPDIGSMSSTHSANPVVCVSGKANLEYIIENKLVERSSSLGELFQKKLNELKNKYSNHIKWLFGNGLVAALIFYDNEGKPLSELCDKICEKAMQKGLILVCTGRESIKMGPPLVISEYALLEGISVLDECIKECIEGK